MTGPYIGEIIPAWAEVDMTRAARGLGWVVDLVAQVDLFSAPPYGVSRRRIGRDGRNPFAGRFVDDLQPLFEAGAMLGKRLMPELVNMLDEPAVSYGKGALVGVNGEMEHGGACVHPMLGKPMRAAISGGKAVISSNVKDAAAGIEPIR